MGRGLCPFLLCRGRMATQFLLIRHGQTDWNVARRRQGHAGPGLNAAGREEAHAAARRLVALGGRFDALVSSDLPRAAETAAIIGKALGLPVTTDTRLRERDQGAWTGQVFAGDYDLYADPDTPGADPLSSGPPGGETGQQVLDRAAAALDEIAARHPGGRVLIVSHGGLISALGWLASGLPVSQFWHLRPANGEVVTLDWPPVQHQR